MFRRRRTQRRGTELDLGDPASFPCRRASPRLLSPEIAGVVHRRRRAQLVDLGGGGFRLESRKPVQKGPQYSVRFAEPSASLRFSAEPVWSRLVRTEGDAEGRNVHPVFAAGFRFSTSLDSGQRRSLGEFVKECAERPVANRKPPRYTMRGGTSAELVAAVPFKVRELSLSGMLVESSSFEEVPGDTLALTLDLPERSLDLSVRLVDARRSSHDGSTQAGVAFDALSAPHSEALDRYLAGQL